MKKLFCIFVVFVVAILMVCVISISMNKKTISETEQVEGFQSKKQELRKKVLRDMDMQYGYMQEMIFLVV